MVCYWREEEVFFVVLKKILILHLKRSKSWRWEKHFFVVWYLTPFQILCLDSKKIVAWCSNQLVCHNHQTNLELSRWWLSWVCIFFFFLAEWKIFIKNRVEKQHQHLPKLHPKDSEELSLGQRNQKCYSTKTSGPIYGQPC